MLSGCPYDINGIALMYYWANQKIFITTAITKCNNEIKSTNIIIIYGINVMIHR